MKKKNPVTAEPNCPAEKKLLGQRKRSASALRSIKCDVRSSLQNNAALFPVGKNRVLPSQPVVGGEAGTDAKPTCIFARWSPSTQRKRRWVASSEKTHTARSVT
jgi:hypothetical protein